MPSQPFRCRSFSFVATSISKRNPTQVTHNSASLAATVVCSSRERQRLALLNKPAMLLLLLLLLLLMLM
jgi:hypothetical protein